MCGDVYVEEDDKIWVECDACLCWYHSSCIGYSNWSLEELNAETIVCPTCEDADEPLY